MKVRIGDLRLALSKNSRSTRSQPEMMAQTPLLQPSSTVLASGAPPTKMPAATEMPNVKSSDELYGSGQEVIKAPNLGTFWRRPKPDTPCFVEEGDMVKPETTVCVLEVMKLFTQVNAGVRGRIIKVCAKDGQMVEYETPLFIVEIE